MKRHNRVGAAVLTAAVLGFGVSRAGADSVVFPVNDGFESPDVSIGTSQSLAYAYADGPYGNGPLSGGAKIGWHFSPVNPGVAGAGIAANGSAFGVIGAANGNGDGGATSTYGQAAFLQLGDGTLDTSGAPSGAASFYQAFYIPSGIATLNFDDETRSGMGPDGINVYLDGQLVALDLTPASSSHFTAVSVVLGAIGGGTHTIGFAGLDPTPGADNASFIDNVSVAVTGTPPGTPEVMNTVAAPLPASAALGGGMLGAFGARAVLRKRLGRRPGIA